MPDYIEREAANYALRECVRAYPDSFYNGIEVARTAIIKLPAANVRPVVLCRDCKYREADGCGAIYCRVWDRWEMPGDAFCYRGERRADHV